MAAGTETPGTEPDKRPVCPAVMGCVPAFGAGWHPCPAEGFGGGFGPISSKASERGHGGTRSRRKPWRFCAPGQSQPPAVRAVSGDGSWRFSETPELRLTLFSKKQANIPAVGTFSLTLSRIQEVLDHE